jgi:predicted transcriptional regulator
MKRTINILIVFSLLCNQVFAGCDWTKIKTNADGTYTYSKALNECVGKLVQDDATKAKQITDYVKALSMKDLSLQESDKRANTWSTTASGLEDRLQKVDAMEKKNEWLFYTIGALSVIGAGYTTAKLTGH